MTTLPKSCDGPTVPVEQMNPRWVAYCRVKGYDSPDDVMRIEGNTLGFSLWIQTAWQTWRKITGTSYVDSITDESHKLFDRWLADSVEADPMGDPHFKRGLATLFISGDGLKFQRTS